MTGFIYKTKILKERDMGKAQTGEPIFLQILESFTILIST